MLQMIKVLLAFFPHYSTSYFAETNELNIIYITTLIIIIPNFGLVGINLVLLI